MLSAGSEHVRLVENSTADIEAAYSSGDLNEAQRFYEKAVADEKAAWTRSRRALHRAADRDYPYPPEMEPIDERLRLALEKFERLGNLVKAAFETTRQVAQTAQLEQSRQVRCSYAASAENKREERLAERRRRREAAETARRKAPPPVGMPATARRAEPALTDDLRAAWELIRQASPAEQPAAWTLLRHAALDAGDMETAALAKFRARAARSVGAG